MKKILPILLAVFLIVSCGNDDENNNNSNKLSTPILLTPSNNATVQRMGDCCYTFEWSEVLNATQYLIEYSSSQDFSNIFESSTSTELYDYHGFNDIIPRANYWRVRALAPGFEPSNYSDVFMFTFVD
jgi:hypothetical protein